MRIIKSASVMMLFLVCAVLAAGIVFSDSVPVVIDRVKVNGDLLQPDGINRVEVERGEEIEVKVIIIAFADDENVQVDAEIKGYEYYDYESTSDVTRVFDVDANSTHAKRLKIMVPSNVEEDDYKLRITVTDRNNDAVVQNYNLRIDAPRHSMEIMDVILTPENVEAGRVVLASARVKNMGDRDEESVKVTVSIPALGLSASDYIDEVEADDSETSEEIYLSIPGCTEAGTYDVVVRVEYDDGHEEATETASVEVLESDSCAVDLDEGDEEEEETEEESDAYDVIFVDVDSAGIDNGTEEADASDARTTMLRSALEMSLIILISALLIIGLVIGFLKLLKEKAE